MNDRRKNSKMRLVKDNFLQLIFTGIAKIKQRNNKWVDALHRNLAYSGKSEYKDFTPEKKIKNGEEYLNALDWALSNIEYKIIGMVKQSN